MMNGLATLKRQTEQFIDEDPTTVVAKRWTKTDDGAGGSTTTGGDLAPQVIRFVPQNSAQVEFRNVDGESVRPDVVAIALVDADFQRGDTMQYTGIDVEIAWVTQLRYEKILYLVAS